MPLGSFVVSDTLFDLLADVPQSTFLRVSIRVKKSWSLPSIVCALRVAFVVARCSSVSVSSLVIASVVAACFCSNISATSFAAAFSLVTCCYSGISDSSFAAAAAAAVFIVCRSRIYSLLVCCCWRLLVLPLKNFAMPLLLLSPSSSCLLENFCVVVSRFRRHRRALRVRCFRLLLCCSHRRRCVLPLKYF